MSKRALLKLATSICLMFCVMISAFNITAHAEPGDDSSEVTLNYNLRGYTGFQLFISESDNETGVELISGDESQFYSGSTKLDPEKTYYLHILSTNKNTFTRLVGKFELNGSGLEFGNNTKILTTNFRDLKFSLTGFGKDDGVTGDTTDKILIPKDVLPAEYLILYKNLNQQVYVSAVIKPVQSVLLAKANITENNVNLTWNAVPGAASYSVERSTAPGGPYTQIASDLIETSYLDKSTSPNTTYYYVVKAKISDTETLTSPEASATLPAETPPATDAKLKVVLEVSEALRLSVDDDLNVNTQMAWTSSEPTVATVNEKGIVTALAPGNTVITVKSVDGSYTDYINVLVVENADDYRLAIDLKIGETARLTADDFTNTANITWAPMDSSIANVTSKGKVTALSKGLVLISAKDADGNIIGRVYVRVRE